MVGPTEKRIGPSVMCREQEETVLNCIWTYRGCVLATYDHLKYLGRAPHIGV